jgi:hypothetical protein
MKQMYVNDISLPLFLWTVAVKYNAQLFYEYVYYMQYFLLEKGDNTQEAKQTTLSICLAWFLPLENNRCQCWILLYTTTKIGSYTYMVYV